MADFIPSSIELDSTTIPVVVTNLPAEQAPTFGAIAQLAQVGGRDTDPSWTVVFTGSDGSECRQGRDQYARYTAHTASCFARSLLFNRIPVLRFEVVRYA